MSPAGRFSQGAATGLTRGAPPRIGLFLTSMPADGGVFQYSLTMLSALARVHGDSDVLVAYTREHWRDRIAALGLRGLRVGHTWLDRGAFALLRRRPASAAALRRAHRVLPLARRLRDANRDLWLFPAQDAASYIAPVNAVTAIHDLMHRYERFPEAAGPEHYGWREAHYRNICRTAVGILVDSRCGAKHVSESYDVPLSDLHILPFVAPAYITEAGPADPSFDDRYSLPGKFLFYPAQFWKHKNHANLIRAVHHLHADLPHLSLVLVGGKKNGYEDVTQLIEQLGVGNRIRIFGYVPEKDMPEFYRRAVALVMPTFFGPTNIPPLEAFATGCPCAVSDIYGMREQVGNAALLFDPRDPRSIADALRRLWNDDALRLSLREKGRERSRSWRVEHFGVRLREIVATLSQQGDVGVSLSKT